MGVVVTYSWECFGGFLRFTVCSLLFCKYPFLLGADFEEIFEVYMHSSSKRNEMCACAVGIVVRVFEG